jgi:hypothetical protein
MDRIEQLLERAKELHQQGDINGALASTYEAVGELYREIKVAKQQAKEPAEATC